MNILIVFKTFYILLDFLGGSFLEQKVLFESLESKTEKGKDVFNVIELRREKYKDVWLMKQSHHGLKKPKWDNIKIVVHKEKKPFKASYHQLKDGVEVEFKANCFRCHPSGPRLIRPNLKSKKVSLGLKDKLIIKKWNLLIKSYGEVELKKNNSIVREVPLIRNLEHSKDILEVKSCTNCHREGGIRGALSKSNLGTIKFMIDQNLMPPWPYKLSKKDEGRLKDFIYGF